MTMTCKMMDELISFYADGALDAESAKLVEEHLQSCAACREALEDLRVLAGACAGAAEEPPSGLRQGILSAVSAAAQCSRVAALIPLAADSSLSPQDRQAVSAHADSCPTCAESLRQYAQLLEALPLADAPAPDGLRERIARATYGRLPARRWAVGLLKTSPWTLRAASAALGACMVGLFAWSTSPRLPGGAPDRNSGPIAERPAAAPAASSRLVKEASLASSQALEAAVADAAVRPVRTRPRLASGWELAIGAQPPAAVQPARVARLPLPAPAPAAYEASSGEDDLLPAIIEKPASDAPAAAEPEPPAPVEPLRLVRAEPDDVLYAQEVDVSQRIREIARQRQLKGAATRFGEVAPGRSGTIKLWQAKF